MGKATVGKTIFFENIGGWSPKGTLPILPPRPFLDISLPCITIRTVKQATRIQPRLVLGSLPDNQHDSA
jgi:hypothetical protein